MAASRALASASIRIANAADVDQWLGKILQSAARTVAYMRAFADDDPLTALYGLKFEKVGSHPVDHRPLNVIEQINQTWTFVTALEAARLLLEWHPEVGPLLLAPGAHASQPLDIMSEIPNLIGAETFAATTPESNAKIARDLKKMASRPENFRYIFFMSPRHREHSRIEKYCRDGVIVCSVQVPKLAGAPLPVSSPPD
jgi:hypothetical protein